MAYKLCHFAVAVLYNVSSHNLLTVIDPDTGLPLPVLDACRLHI